MRLNKVQQIFNVVKSHSGSWRGTEPENLTQKRKRESFLALG